MSETTRENPSVIVYDVRGEGPMPEGSYVTEAAYLTLVAERDAAVQKARYESDVAAQAVEAMDAAVREGRIVKQSLLDVSTEHAMRVDEIKDIRARLRAAFPHLDAPPCELTAAECVARLKELGAHKVFASRVYAYNDRDGTCVSKVNHNVLILPANIGGAK